MAGIVSATVAQVEDARRRAEQLAQELQKFSQGTLSPTTLNSDQIARVDTLVDQTVAALALLNT